jgi:poly-beta-1,6-N-acetyl-D-glucosamine biosynthesis protein PgaD
MSQRPLIIKQSALTSRPRRVFAVVLTGAAWSLWLLTWMPLLPASLEFAGLHVVLPRMEGGAILRTFPLGSRMGIAVVAVSMLVIFMRHLREIFGAPKTFLVDRAKPVDIRKLAARASTTEDCLRSWQAQKTLYVEHGEHGEITWVATIPDSAASPQD